MRLILGTMMPPKANADRMKGARSQYAYTELFSIASCPLCPIGQALTCGLFHHGRSANSSHGLYSEYLRGGSSVVYPVVCPFVCPFVLSVASNGVSSRSSLRSLCLLSAPPSGTDFESSPSLLLPFRFFCVVFASAFAFREPLPSMLAVVELGGFNGESCSCFEDSRVPAQRRK